MLTRRIAVSALIGFVSALRTRSARAAAADPALHGTTRSLQGSTPTTCTPKPRPDGAGGPVSDPGCLCDPGQLRIMPPAEVPLVYDDTTLFGEIYFQGLDCEWYRLPCPAVCSEMR